MEKKTVVLYTGAGVGHLSPMLELAKALLRHGGGQLDVAVAVVEPPVTEPGFAATLARAKASNASVAFHVLHAAGPPVPDGPNSQAQPVPEEEDEPLARMLRFLRAVNAPLRDLLRSLMQRRRVQAVVVDMFCTDALDVAAELGLPAYFFFPSGGAGLAVFLALPGTSLVGLGVGASADAVMSFPGAPPLRVSDLPPALVDGGEACRGMVRAAARMPDARGILVNSSDSLEPCAARALRDGLCVPDPDRPTPPVYFVGPLVACASGSDGGHEPECLCLRWMDAQPDRSVVFLCFGSQGTFAKEQVEEIAVGLESSGQRFLWVLRSPPRDAAAAGGPADDVDALLPAGFTERTKGRGLVVGSWAPQVDVLRHRAAGAFVTHCGWNSTLEGVAAGLPLLCWPLYAEQKMNRVRIVEDLRLGVGMAMDGDGGGAVKAEEVEAKVRWVMGHSDGARALRARAAAARERAAEALADGGSSRAALIDFIRDLECALP